jgi:DNA-binding ferritin-like protein
MRRWSRFRQEAIESYNAGPHFPDYHGLWDEHVEQLYRVADTIPERSFVGGNTLAHP